MGGVGFNYNDLPLCLSFPSVPLDNDNGNVNTNDNSNANDNNNDNDNDNDDNFSDVVLFLDGIITKSMKN